MFLGYLPHRKTPEIKPMGEQSDRGRSRASRMASECVRPPRYDFDVFADLVRELNPFPYVFRVFGFPPGEV